MARRMDLRHTYHLKEKLLFSALGVICIALGTALCRRGNVGVDPFTAMNMGLSDLVGIDFGTFQLMVNLVILIVVFLLNRFLIGLGTLINMIFTGYLIEFFTWLFSLMPRVPDGVLRSSVFLILGTLLFTLGVSLYLKTRMGVAPIDALAPLIVQRTRFGYTGVRMSQDIIVMLIALVSGGPVGLFTIVAAFFTGPLITGWNKLFTLRIYRRFKVLNKQELSLEKS